MLPIRQTTSREDMGENGPRNKQVQRAGANRRPVLGNVTNQVRRQPQRVAKERHSVVHAGPTRQAAAGQENDISNVQGKKAVGGAFTIFEDVPAPRELLQEPLQDVIDLDDEPMLDQENIPLPEPQQLHDAVVGLNIGDHVRQNHIPLAPLQLERRFSDAPMLFEDGQEHEIGQPDEYGLDPYFMDIYDNLRIRECENRPTKNYMNRQTDVSTSMRNILVDWLVEVGEEYKLHRETFFLAVDYIDRFLSLVGVHRPKLQLVGTACMFIAAKYEEIYPPDISDFVYITDDTYTRNQVIKMESVILKILEFKLAVPTVTWFCERFLEVLKPSDRCKNLAHFLTELSVIEIEEFLRFRPSEVAASAIILARSTVGEGNPWPESAKLMSKYSLSDLEPCVRRLFKQYSRKADIPQQAVIEKYKQEK
ncbi:G2/mitotic-specific cyclin-a-like [Plakobranchus ocellatus]|uniref:G2/mitotic-specific cyclin-a-like n=1 Tax=Plakobranchus ocellatus TaxID=259542 RepID=A0AAV4AP97_9GAST|nr:G2/mitotic-specific cyclin-a-like [Plakobranchus ocellatus]